MTNPFNPQQLRDLLQDAIGCLHDDDRIGAEGRMRDAQIALDHSFPNLYDPDQPGAPSRAPAGNRLSPPACPSCREPAAYILETYMVDTAISVLADGSWEWSTDDPGKTHWDTGEIVCDAQGLAELKCKDCGEMWPAAMVGEHNPDPPRASQPTYDLGCRECGATGQLVVTSVTLGGASPLKPEGFDVEPFEFSEFEIVRCLACGIETELAEHRAASN